MRASRVDRVTLLEFGPALLVWDVVPFWHRAPASAFSRMTGIQLLLSTKIREMDPETTIDMCCYTLKNIGHSEHTRHHCRTKTPMLLSLRDPKNNVDLCKIDGRSTQQPSAPLTEVHPAMLCEANLGTTQDLER